MGCDIHWHSETKQAGKWECDQKASFNILKEEDNYTEMDDFPGRDRDYWFFGLIQPGVRTDWVWSFPERVGIPQDLSTEVQAIFNSWSGDAHSEGYLTRAEIKTKLIELQRHQASHLINPSKDSPALLHQVSRLNSCLQSMQAEVPDTDQRIVFWFDN